MNDDHPGLLDLAGALIDGTPVDWNAAESQAADESVRAIVAELRVLARLGEVYDSLPFDAPVALEEPEPGPAQWSTRWGELTLLERIGGGSYGEVFRARDPHLDRDVALKLLHTPVGASSAHQLGEGRLLARVRHPNVVSVHGAAQVDGRVGFWMEFVSGRTLADRVRSDGPLTPDEVARIGRTLCDALAAVHAAGLLHCDIKAQNVMEAEAGRIVLMDFGAGRLVDSAEGRTGLAGTPLYIAPELFEGGSATVHSDLYSVGVLLYHLLTGTYPVTGRAVGDVRERHRRGERRAIASVRAHTPLAMAEVLERALHPDPLRRFASAQDMGAALTGLLAAHGTPGRRRPGVAAATGAACLIAAIVWLTVNVDRFGSDAPAGRDQAGMAAADSQRGRTRPVAVPDSTFPSRPSLDGRYYPFIDVRQAALGITELVTGRVRILARSERRPAEFPFGSTAVSPDSQWVAYSWSTQDGGELRVIGIDGGSPRTLVRHRDVSAALYPVQWAGDGTEILAAGPTRGGGVLMALVNLATGAIRSLKTSPSRPQGVTVSPDGRFVAYDRPHGDGSRGRDIVVMATDGSAEWPLVQGPSNDLNPEWTPDGDGILFVSDRTGTFGLWLAHVVEGHSSREPVVINRDIGPSVPLGVTRDGDFYYFSKTDLIDVFTVSLDPVAGTTAGKPLPITPSRIGSNTTSDWSADGRHVAFVSIRSPVATDQFSRALSVWDRTTGATRDLWPALAFFTGPRWSPDGRSILVYGNREGQSGIHAVDAATGAVKTVVEGQPGIGEYEWTADGHAVLYRSGPNRIRSRHVTTGTDTEVLNLGLAGIERLTPRSQPPHVPSSRTFQVSPDGSWMALTAWSGDGEHTRASIQILPRHGGSPRVLLEGPRLALHGWTPDGHALLVSRPASENDPAAGLWWLPIEGGLQRPVGLDLRGLSAVRISPDGRLLTFTAGFEGGEVRVMEDVLAAGR